VNKARFKAANRRFQRVLTPQTLRSLLNYGICDVFRVFGQFLADSGLPGIDSVPDRVRFALFGE
jgi:hypothetical protein